MDSHPPQLRYPWGNFSDVPDPHLRGYERSLGPAFTSGLIAFRSPVRQTFGLTLHGGFPTRLSLPLGTPDTFAGAYHPSQTAHQVLSLRSPRLAGQLKKGGVPLTLHQPPGGLEHRSRLHSASPTMPQDQAAVKFHRVFSPLWSASGFEPRYGFTGPRKGTAGTSLNHSCTPIFNRQGIWLPFSRAHISWPVKRVRVTPGFHRPFAQLDLGLRYRHWPGLIPRTHPYGLAGNCVFVKQSGAPCHCDLRIRAKLRIAGTPYPEVTGLIGRFPSPALFRQALAFSACAPVSVLGTVTRDRSSLPFQGPLALARATKSPYHAFSRFSPLRYSAAFGA